MMVNRLNLVKVKFIRNKNKKQLSIHYSFIVLPNSSLPAKQLFVMCNNETEQKQWIAKLLKKISRQPIPEDELITR